MKILKNKIKILKLLIIIFLISITIIIVNSNIKLFQSDDYIFLKIFQKSVNQPKDIDKTKKEENYIFKVNLKNIDIKQIDLMKTADKSTYVNEKIAPGTSGNFNILLETNKNSKYKIYFQSINEKPKNLYFKAIKDGKEIAKTETLEKLSENLKGDIKKKKKIKINIHWYWDFESSETTDIQDTEDSKKIKKYQFNLYALGEEI